MLSKVIFILVLTSIAFAGCSDRSIAEFTFRKLVERDLREECGKSSECKEAVSQQIEDCLERSNWRELLQQEDNEDAIIKFHNNFRSCFKNKNGIPLF